MKKKLIIVFVIFISIGIGLFYLLTMGNIGVKYDTVEVMKGEAGIYVQDVGKISSKNIRRYYGNGINKVEEMPLKLGDRVKKGQLLVKYEDDMALNMEIMDLNIEILDIEIQKVEKQIEALEAAYSDAESGTDMESVNSARIEVARIQSQIDSAKKDYERIETLYNEGIFTRVELEQSAETINQLESSLGIAQNTYNQLGKGISDSMRKKYEAEIDAMILAINILEKNSEILEKNKEEAKEENNLYADVDGIITELNSFEGDKPPAGVMIIEILDPTEKVLLVDFMVEDAIRMSPGLEAEIQDFNLDINIDNLKVDQVYPKAFVTLSELGVEENRQTVAIDLSTSGNTLAFGLELETMVMIESPREILFVPAGAVVEKNSKQYVKILLDGEPVEREIITGEAVKGNLEVLDGVEEGEQVILNYQEE